MNFLNFNWIWALLLLVPSAWGQCFGENDDASETGATIDGRSLSNASTEFALNLFRHVLPSNGGVENNILVSPFSVWSALLLTYMGARDRTKAEMENGLELNSNNQKRVSALYDDLEGRLLHSATQYHNYTFRTVNRIYLNQSVELRRCVADHFQDDIVKVDFKRAPELSRRNINRWVRRQTDNKIRNLIPSNYIDRNTTLMVLVNALYFKGLWSKQFDERATRRQQFFVSATNTAQVTMMQQENWFPFLKNSTLDLSAIELPYSGDDVSMVILLPNRGTKAEDLVSRLTPEILRSVYDEMELAEVDVFLPMFKHEQSMELKEHLEALGIEDLFDQNKADLSGFTGKRGLYVKYVQQKSYIEVNEGGTEAAASTGVIGVTTFSAPRNTFVVDRPFFFLIRDKPTNTILFMGLIRNPTTS